MQQRVFTLQKNFTHVELIESCIIFILFLLDKKNLKSVILKGTIFDITAQVTLLFLF